MAATWCVLPTPGALPLMLYGGQRLGPKSVAKGAAFDAKGKMDPQVEDLVKQILDVGLLNGFDFDDFHWSNY